MSADIRFGRAGKVVSTEFATLAPDISFWSYRKANPEVPVKAFQESGLGQVEAGDSEISGQIRVAARHSKAPIVSGQVVVLTLQTRDTAPYVKIGPGSAYLREVSDERNQQAGARQDEITYAYIGCGSDWPDPAVVQS